MLFGPAPQKTQYNLIDSKFGTVKVYMTQKFCFFFMEEHQNLGRLPLTIFFV